MWKYFLNFGNGSKFKILGNKNIFGTFLEFYKFRKNILHGRTIVNLKSLKLVKSSNLRGFWEICFKFLKPSGFTRKMS